MGLIEKACATCGRPFVPRSSRQRRCPAHEPRGRAARSPTTQAQDAEYARERARVLAPDAAGRPPLCHWGCGHVATTVDHLEPVAVAVAAGRKPRHVGNLVPACGHCNFSRQDREDWTP